MAKTCAFSGTPAPPGATPKIYGARDSQRYFLCDPHIFVTRKVREGHDYKRIMAITCHKTFVVFQRYNNPTEEDVKAVVLANSPRKMIG